MTRRRGRPRRLKGFPKTSVRITLGWIFVPYGVRSNARVLFFNWSSQSGFGSSTKRPENAAIWKRGNAAISIPRLAIFLRLLRRFSGVFLRFLRQNLRFSILRFENAAIFLRLRFFGTLRSSISKWTSRIQVDLFVFLWAHHRAPRACLETLCGIFCVLWELGVWCSTIDLHARGRARSLVRETLCESGRWVNARKKRGRVLKKRRLVRQKGGGPLLQKGGMAS